MYYSRKKLIIKWKNVPTYVKYSIIQNCFQSFCEITKVLVILSGITVVYKGCKIRFLIILKFLTMLGVQNDCFFWDVPVLDSMSWLEIFCKRSVNKTYNILHKRNLTINFFFFFCFLFIRKHFHLKVQS